MEFKFRAINEQDPTHHPPSSSFNYFIEQAPQAGYSNADNGRAHEFLRNPINVREAILRVLEKERIREEITAAEISRRRLLEAEVRREMLMEREMALRRGDGFSFPWTSLFEPRPSILHLSEGMSLEERITLSLEARLGHSERREIGVGVQTLPFQRNVEEHKISEVKPLREVRKDKVILQAKPDANLSGAKRKAVTPAAVGAGGISVTGSKKKPKEEWSCAICQVSATNERVLNEHLQGKKHKAKEAGLRAERKAKNFSLGLFPKKTAKPSKFAETTDNPSSDQKISDNGNSKKNKAADDSKKKEVECKKNKCKFWCELCQKGAHSEKVMKDHEKGKKHVFRVQELERNGEMAEATRKAKDGNEAAGDGKC